ncbi:MAG: hypothetical protein JNM56_07095 [Planctomycetia bacterium]|nr:hypothetical protein [Planctomycetia bacterium]
MTLFAGLDLNASRVRGVSGSATLTPRLLTLDAETRGELPLSISLENRRPEVGTAGARICRRLPYLTCDNFLPHLGAPRQWTAGRHRLDAGQALALAFKQLKPSLAECKSAAAALPAYLTRDQGKLFLDLAKQAKLPALNWIAAPLAVAWAARSERPWYGLALVLDVDDHALTWHAVQVDEPPATPQARLLAEQLAPTLSLRAWKDRILTGIADRCVRHSRRDPRASATAEQMLYEQFDRALEAYATGGVVPLVVQTDHWYQDLVLQPEELEHYCQALARQAIGGLPELLAAAAADQPPVLILATATAARLPGLLRALEQHSGPRTRLLSLPPDAVARAALDLAARWHEGSLPRGPLDRTLPLPKSTPLVRGPAPDLPSRGRLPSHGPNRLRSQDDDFSIRIDE